MRLPATKTQNRRKITTYMPGTRQPISRRIPVEAVTHTVHMTTVTSSPPPKTTAVEEEHTHSEALTMTCTISLTNTQILVPVLVEVLMVADPRQGTDHLIWSSIVTPRAESCPLLTITTQILTITPPLLTTTHPSTTAPTTTCHLTHLNQSNNTNNTTMGNSHLVIESPRKTAMPPDTRRTLKI